MTDEVFEIDHTFDGKTWEQRTAGRRKSMLPLLLLDIQSW